jgi:hypothetical protein
MRVKIKDIDENDAFYGDRDILIGRTGEVEEKYFMGRNRCRPFEYIFCHIKMDDSIETVKSWHLRHTGDRTSMGNSYSLCFAHVLLEKADLTIDKELFKID